MSEPLLPMNREYSEAEKVNIRLSKRIRQLNSELKMVCERNDDLSKRISRIERENATLLSELMSAKERGETITITNHGNVGLVTRKAHEKLQRRFGELEKRFWEVVNERDNLKANI